MANENRYYKTPFAESGNKNEVPDVSTGGALGFDTGYGPDFELPQGTVSRKRVGRDNFNGLWNGATKNIKQWQEKLYPTWIEDNGDGVPFSYSENMIVSHNNVDYVSLEDGNQEEPGTGNKWIVEVSDINNLNKSFVFKTVALMRASLIIFPVGKKIFWQGYHAESDGGSNWGIVTSGAHTDDGLEFFTLDNGDYVLANIKGSTINVLKAGAKKDFDGTSGTDNAAPFNVSLGKNQPVRIPRGDWYCTQPMLLNASQELSGDGYDSTKIWFPDAFAGAAISYKQGCKMSSFALRKVTVGTFNNLGTGLLADNTGNTAWNSVAQHILISGFNIAERVLNYRHERNGMFYFYNDNHVIVGDGSTPTGTLTFNTCAFLYAGNVALNVTVGATHTQVYGTTFEFAYKGVVCDSVLSIKDSYIADEINIPFSGGGKIYADFGNVVPFQSFGDGNNYGKDYVATDVKNLITGLDIILENATLDMRGQFVNGNQLRGGMIGAGKYKLNNCFIDNQSATDFGFSNRWIFEYTASTRPKIRKYGSGIKSYLTDGLFKDTDNLPTNANNTGKINPWGGAVISINDPAKVQVPFDTEGKIPIGTDLLLIVFTGIEGGKEFQYWSSVGVVDNSAAYPDLTRGGFKSNNPSPGVVRWNNGYSYDSTDVICMGAMVLTTTADTGMLDFYSFGATGEYYGMMLVEIEDESDGKPIGWVE